MAITGQTRTVYPSVAGAQPSANEISVYDNLAATADPTASNDVTQGYQVGSKYYNTTGGRSWECQSNAAGAAVWYYTGNIPGTSAGPSSNTIGFGSGTGSFPGAGDISKQISGTAVQPAQTAIDCVLETYTLPASSFDIAGRGVVVTAAGYFGATTNNKTIKLIYNPSGATVGLGVTGGTTIASTGVTSSSSSGFVLVASVYKYGAAASNTQLSFANLIQAGVTLPALPAPSLTTAVESSAILIAVTGNAASATTDINLNFFGVEARD